MPHSLRIDDASPEFLKALDQLVQAYSADLRHKRATSPCLQIQPISRPRRPASRAHDPWDLAIVTSCYGPDAHEAKFWLPPQPSMQEMMKTPRSDIKFPFTPRVDGESNSGLEVIEESPNFQLNGSVNSEISESAERPDSVTRCSTDILGRNSSQASAFRIEPVKPGSVKDTMRRIVKNIGFEVLFSLVIVINCFTMGLEAEQEVKGPSSGLSETLLLVSEHLFTALFTIELIVKFVAFGYVAFLPSFPEGRWNIADAFLVFVTGVLFTWIIPILSLMFRFDNNSSFVSTLTVFRSIRLMRLVKVLRRIPQFREAWLLLRGLLDSARVLLWTIVVIVFITYLFAILGMVTISKQLAQRRDEALFSDAERHEDLSELLEFVGGIDRLMYTLVQLLTLDSWNGIVRRIVKELNWAWMYFYTYIAVAVFVLMNLVTAIIVDNALSTSRLDEQEKVRKMEEERSAELKELQLLFDLMDADGSGTLSWMEFKASFEDPEMKKKWKLLDFEPEECKELFRLLDNEDGEIATAEFFHGLSKMKGVAQSKDIFRVQKDVEVLKSELCLGYRPSSVSPYVSVRSTVADAKL